MPVPYQSLDNLGCFVKILHIAGKLTGYVIETGFPKNIEEIRQKCYQFGIPQSKARKNLKPLWKLPQVIVFLRNPIDFILASVITKCKNAIASPSWAALHR